MEEGHDVLPNASKEDQHVSATDQVHFRERGILNQIMSAEDTHLAQCLADLISPLGARKIAAQTFRADICHYGLGIFAAPSFFDRRCCDVGSEDLYRVNMPRFLEVLL